MFRTALCIKMLMILFTRDVVSIKELADMLETNPRNIPEFRKELEVAGYPIETVSGRYGGYRLKKTCFFPTVRLTDAEKKALVESFEYVTKQKNFPSTPAYQTAMEKIMAANRYRTIKDDEMILIPRHPLAMPEEEIQERYAAVSECVEHRTKLKMEYRSNDNVVRERIVHPYKLYMYNSAWFMLAYCELAKEIRYFKLNRMISFSQLPQKFDYIYSYREGSEWHEWLDKYGMTRNGDWYDVKLKFTGKYAMVVQDYLYGKDQITECVDSNTTILTLKMKYKDSISNFVLGYGEFCEVLEPEWLKDEVLKKAQAIMKLYGSDKETT